MYQKRVPKSQKPDNNLYTIYHCHSTLSPKEWYNRDNHRILSIDPGRKNFCFRIEYRDSKCIKVEAYEKMDLISNLSDQYSNIDYIYRNVITILEKYKNLILTCNIIIIERQLMINYKMVRFSQHVITYLMMLLKDNNEKSVILEIAPHLKSKQLNAPKKDIDVKKWSVEYAIDLLNIRNDTDSLNIIKKAPKSKKDDLSDTVIQIEAVFKLFNLPLTTDIYHKEDINVPVNHINPIKINVDLSPFKLSSSSEKL